MFGLGITSFESCAFLSSARADYAVSLKILPLSAGGFYCIFLSVCFAFGCVASVYPYIYIFHARQSSEAGSHLTCAPREENQRQKQNPFRNTQLRT